MPASNKSDKRSHEGVVNQPVSHYTYFGYGEY